MSDEKIEDLAKRSVAYNTPPKAKGYDDVVFSGEDDAKEPSKIEQKEKKKLKEKPGDENKKTVTKNGEAEQSTENKNIPKNHKPSEIFADGKKKNVLSSENDADPRENPKPAKSRTSPADEDRRKSAEKAGKQQRTPEKSRTHSPKHVPINKHQRRRSPKRNCLIS